MTARLPGPGPQISAGRLRVDAGRAIKKLREYQLADRTAWILEAIRAAVASGATKISLSGDANDIWLAWECTPWPAEVLPRLFDELVSPAAGSDVQHVRLLAAAVNSALGMEPAYVDVFRIDRDGTAQVARYTPDVLAEPAEELEESPLQHVTARPAEPPDDAKPGMAVHLRRRLGLDVVAYFLGAPPELALAEQACRDIAVPLHVRGHVLSRSESQDVLRVPLGETVDGFIAVSDRVIGEPQLEIAEHGVILARYPLSLDTAGSERAVPLRVFVDAARMPTNASRSQVRRDKHPISTAEARAKALLPEVVAQLGARVKAGDERARATALAWLAAQIGGPHWHIEAPGVRGALRELAKLPLVRNAVGEPRGLTAHWIAEVHTGRNPLPSELAAWVGDMLWIPPGDAALTLLQGTKIDGSAASRHIRWAKRQAAAQRKFYSHAKREARVVAVDSPRIRARLGAPVPDSIVDPSWFTDLTGEICIYGTGSGGSLVVLLEGRELERISMPSAISFDAVIDSPRAKPSERYRGVERNAEYTRIERAVNAGIICAIEALALGEPVEGHDVLHSIGRAVDAALVRNALALARELSLKIRGPLTLAGAFESTDGRWIRLADLQVPAIGVTAPGRPAVTPKHRPVLYATDAERQLLAKVYGGRIVRYDRAQIAVAEPVLLSAALADGLPCALGIQDGELVGAIAPANKSTLQLQHAGVRLAVQAYKSRYIDCAILVDSDAIVPDTDWKTATDDAGLSRRDYGAWELALVRALARSLIGERQPQLRTNKRAELRGAVGMELCEALVRGNPGEMLGAELCAAFCAAPLLSLLGKNSPASIDDLVAMYPSADASIPVIFGDAIPVPGFFPLLAPSVIGHAVAKLANRKWHEATSELERRRKTMVFDQNLAKHRARPADEITLDVPERMEVVGSGLRGYVGVDATARGTRVYVENRLFARLDPPDGLPLAAAIELAPEHCGETFTVIPDAIVKWIAAEIRRAVPPLVVAIASSRPEALATLGPVRRLLGACLVQLGPTSRAALCAAPAFRTVQGEIMSLDAVAQPHGAIRFASWQDEWLGPADGEPTTALDEPLLSIASQDGELRSLCETLSERPIVDVSEQVARLQAHRRMARGLMPTPTVPGVPPLLKRALSQLGDAGKKLGHGEIGLVDGAASSVRLHDHGRFVKSVRIDVLPPIDLAVEEQEIGGANLTDLDARVDAFLGLAHPITRTAQQLATQLAMKVLADVTARALLTPRMLRGLARAALAEKIEPKQVDKLPVFETMDGRGLDWSGVAAQIELFGDVWAVSRPINSRPLDDRRVVLVLSAEDIALAKANGHPFVAAEPELALDEQARVNRARAPVAVLALPTQHGVIAEVELAGDGVTSPRGIVAVLTPAITGARGIHVHRAMQPLGMMPDPCAWPTIAVVDDARLVANRTWTEPKPDQTWQAVVKAVRRASEAAIETIGEAPADALVTIRIDPEVRADIKELRKDSKSQLRGLVWLIGAPLEGRGAVNVSHPLGVAGYVPENGLAMGGQLLLHIDGSVRKDLAIAQVCARMHGHLIRRLLEKRADHDPDLVAAHVAHALALDTIKPADVRGIQFDCFAPAPLEPRGLVSLFRRQAPVAVIMPDEASTTEALVDDGSQLARVVLSHLGKRARRIVAAPPVPTPAPPQPVIVAPPKRVEPAAPKPPPKPAPPPPPHPLEGLVALLSQRVGALGIKGYEFLIEDSRSPMVRFEMKCIVVAGDNERLRKLASHVDSSSPWLPAAIDALAAHVVSLLNIALTEITDATEVAALAALLANQRSAGPPRSRRSS